MKNSVRLGVGTLLLGLVLVGNLFFLLQSLNTLRDHRNWVVHTYQVTGEIEQVLSSLRDIETGQRGYLLSRDERFLEPYNASLRELNTHIDSLASLTRDNPAQQARIPRVRDGSQAFIALLRAQIDAVRASGRAGTLNMTELTRARSAMDSLRGVMQEMHEDEKRLLALRDERVVQSGLNINIAFGVGTLLNIVLLLVAYYFLRRHLGQQELDLDKARREAWIRDSLAELSAAGAGDLRPEEIGRRLLDTLATRTPALRGSAYVLDDGALQLVASYGADLKPARRIALGEGLVGESARTAKFQHLRDVPAGQATVHTSLVEREPRELCIVPLVHESRVLGLVELASFDPFLEKQIELLRNFGGTAAVSFSSAVSRRRTQELLEETQRQSEELQAQQEELRTSNEELTEQARALEESQNRLQLQQEELRQNNEELEQQGQVLELQRNNLALRNDELEATRKQVEAKAHDLEMVNQYKSDFMAKMSHELRTPLNSLLILSSLLGDNREQNLTDQQIEFARTISNSGKDLLNLINDILDLSKIEARRLHLHVERFSLDSMAAEVQRTFAPLAENKGLMLNIRRGTDLPDFLTSDYQRVIQVLRNFLSNAIKFTEQGSVSFEIDSVPGRPGESASVRFSVRDTGIGIANAKRDLIFEAFEQADSSTSRNYGGTGLGLTISRELALLLRGRIEVQSEEGRGSTFSLIIPSQIEVSPGEESPLPTASRSRAGAATTSSVSSASSAGAFVESLAGSPAPSRSSTSAGALGSSENSPNQAPARGAPAPAHSLWHGSNPERSILIVEDDHVFADTLLQLARAQGFEAVVAHDGESALEALRTHHPRGILLDVKLPGLSGLSVLEQIKMNPTTRHIPVHMLSGTDYAASAMRLGAVGYLAKPAAKEDIQAALGRIESVVKREMKRVLVVEDDPAQQKAIAHLIAGGGLETVCVGMGKQALEKLNSETFDCVILDLSLPDMTGFEWLERMHQSMPGPKPPVVVYTGKDITREDELRLRKYSESIILKGARSPERLLDEVSLFLHRVENDLPEDQRQLLRQLRNRESIFEGRTVLLVDDDLRNIFALMSALEGKGLRVRVGRNGEEAVDLVQKENDIDLVLMDIMMPKMDGFEATRRIRAMGGPQAKLPIIALTAKAMKGDQEKCLAAGASDYLPKPVSLENLFSLLRVWMPGGDAI